MSNSSSTLPLDKFSVISPKQRLRCLEVVQKELETMKKDKKVYVQQRNSNIFFLDSRVDVLASCKLEAKNLQKH